MSSGLKNAVLHIESDPTILDDFIAKSDRNDQHLRAIAFGLQGYKSR